MMSEKKSLGLEQLRDLDLDNLDLEEEKHQEDKPTKTQIQKSKDDPIKSIAKPKKVEKSKPKPKKKAKEITPEEKVIKVHRVKKVRSKLETKELEDIEKKSILEEFAGTPDFVKLIYRLVTGKTNRSSGENLYTNFNLIVNALHVIFSKYSRDYLDKTENVIKVIEKEFNFKIDKEEFINGKKEKAP